MRPAFTPPSRRSEGFLILRAPWLAALLAIVLAACSTGAGGPTSSIGSASPSAPLGTSSASASPTASAAAFPLTLTDDDGTKVELEAEPDTIVSLTPAVTETLFALGVGDRIAGKAQDVFLYPPEAAAIPDVATFQATDVEKVAALEPDLVFAGGNFGTPPEAIEQLRKLGIPVVVVYARTVDDSFDDIEFVGQAVGRAGEATAITDRLRSEFEAVEAAVDGLPKPRVYYELDATGAYYAPSDESFLAEMIDLAGGEPITTGSTDKFDISAERLIEADPELILLADAAFGVTPDQVRARPGWNVMTAVRSDAIRPIDDATITRPGPRLFGGLALLAKSIHPDAPIPSASPIPPVPPTP
jgi:iron complex transport system substrate-binding protein